MTENPSDVPERRDIIHRCYMTGQRCVYSQDLLSRHAQGTFSLSQFSGDFNHMWEFNLRPLAKGIRRADVVARTGYVMCSRICHPIQESEEIIADVTTGNLNVFYELGLACALGKRVLILRHETLTATHILDFLQAVGLSEHTHPYNSADDVFSHAPLPYRSQPVKKFRELSRAKGNSVFVFSNESKSYLWPDKHVASIRSRARKIIDIARRALANLQVEKVVERCHSILRERGDSKRAVSAEAVKRHVEALGKDIRGSDRPGPAGSVLDAMMTSEVILIDTSLRDFETYFWLGLCHGLEREVIPFFVVDSQVQDPALPFDIRTLWHIAGSFEHTATILSQLSEILVEISSKALSRDATSERDRFWEPVFDAPRLRLYVGTGRSRDLASKQVVGDWDLRTIQEINSFVLRAQSNIDVVIERPVFRKDTYDTSRRRPASPSFFGGRCEMPTASSLVPRT